MNKTNLGITGIVVVLIVGATISYLRISSRNLSPAGTAAYSYKGVEISVDYHRPSKRGRRIFGYAKDGALQPNGKYWRLGSNYATEISFSRDVTFAGNPVKAGRYRMYMIPGENAWTIALNSELGVWGGNEPNYAMDVLRAGLLVENVASETEVLTINFDGDSTGVNMHIAWDRAHVRVPIGVQ